MRKKISIVGVMAGSEPQLGATEGPQSEFSETELRRIAEIIGTAVAKAHCLLLTGGGTGRNGIRLQSLCH